MNDLMTAIAASARAAPHLDPGLHFAVARANKGDVGQTVEDSSAIGGFAQATKYAEAFKAQPDDIQRKLWDHAAPPLRDMISSTGYQPPKEKDEGLFGEILHTAGGIVNAPFKLINDLSGNAAGSITGDVLHVAGAPLRAVQHGIRTGLMVAAQGSADAHSDSGGIDKLFSPSSWADAWNQSEHGEQTFNPRMVQKLEDQYGTANMPLAKRLAGGETIDQITQGMAPDQALAMTQQVQTDDNLKQLVTMLEHSKLSLGRSIANGMGIKDDTLFRIVSGSIDATADIVGDPLIVGGKATKAARGGRFAVYGAEDVRNLAANSSSVQRYLDDVSTHLAEHAGGDKEALGRLVQRFPKTAPVIPAWVHEGITNPEQLTDWFAGQAGLGALARGRVGGMLERTVTMPSVSRVGQGWLSVKGAASDVIDFGADAPYRLNAERAAELGLESATALADRAPEAIANAKGIPLITPMARSTRRFLTLIPEGGRFDPNGPAAVATIDRIAREALPAARARELVGLFAASPNLDQKFGVYKGLLSELGRSAGAEEWMSGLVTKLDDANAAGRAYSVGNVDKMLVDGKQISAAVLPSDLATEWSLPSYRGLVANSRRLGVNKALYGAVNNDAVDRFMQVLWKPLTLLRLGFPIRAGGEEIVGQALREGPIGVLRARVGLSRAMREAKPEETGAIGRAWNSMVGHLPESVQSKITSVGDAEAEAVASRTSRAFAKVKGSLPNDVYKNTAADMSGLGYFDGPFAEHLTAAHGAGGYLTNPDELMRYAHDGHKLVPARLLPTGSYKAYADNENLFTTMWHNQLEKLGKDDLGARALSRLETDRTTAVNELADHILSDGFAETRKLSVRNTVLRDGRQVGVDATEREAAQDWAGTVLDHAASMVKGKDGAYAVDPKALRNGQVPTLEELAKIDLGARPPAAVGDDLLPVSGEGWYRGIIDKGFHHIVGRPMNWIARQPMYVHNWAVAREEIAPLAKSLGDEAAVREIIADRALAKTIPYIHDPALRSQFAERTRNLMPFWFAQEQFFKRWARTFTHSPEAFREGQLTMNGLRSVGFIHKDDQGNDVFTYPLVGAIQRDVVAKGYKLLTGHDVDFPLPVGFTGEVRFATPGLERLGLPSFGPLMSIPVNYLATRFPELQQNAQSMLGERGTGRGVWEQILPTTLSRFAKIFASPDSDAGMHSSALQAMQYLYAHGHAPPEGASPEDVQKFQDRVKHLARTIQITRTIYGFAAPAAPNVDLDPEHMSQKLNGLIKTLGIHEGMSEFIRENPNASPYTVFQSKNSSGAYIPPVQETMKYLEDHANFIKSYPRAGGWFIPDSPGDKTYDPAVYREQLLLGMRERKTLDEFTKELYYRDGAAEYFDQKRAHDADLAAVGKRNTKLKAKLNADWKGWSDTFKAAHPVFTEELMSAGSAQKRVLALGQLHSALLDPRAPNTPLTAHVSEMVAAYDDLKDQLGGLAAKRTTRAIKQRDALKGQFISWANGFVTENTDTRGMYDKLIRPDIEGV